MEEDVLFYRSNITHIIPEGAALFITFRLYDSIPAFLVKQYEAEYRKAAKLIKALHRGRQEVARIRLRALKFSFLEKCEALMDEETYGEYWLKDPCIAEILENKLHQLDGEMYRLLCYCIMSNHVHLVIDLSGSLSYADPLYAQRARKSMASYPKIMQFIKGSTARQINEYLGRSGCFWQRDNYERYIRNERHLFYAINYTLKNPVKAGICTSWDRFPHNYLAPELRSWFFSMPQKYPRKDPLPW